MNLIKRIERLVSPNIDAELASMNLIKRIEREKIVEVPKKVPVLESHKEN